MGPYRHVGGCMGAHKCTGSIQIYGGVQMYNGCADVWGMYRCMGDVQMLGSYTSPKHLEARHTPTCLPTTLGYYIHCHKI